MDMKVMLEPCGHNLCEDCFEKFNEECKYCGLEIQNTKALHNNLL